MDEAELFNVYCELLIHPASRACLVLVHYALKGQAALSDYLRVLQLRAQLHRGSDQAAELLKHQTLLALLRLPQYPVQLLINLPLLIYAQGLQGVLKKDDDASLILEDTSPVLLPGEQTPELVHEVGDEVEESLQL